MSGIARWVQSHPHRNALPQEAWRPAPVDIVSAKAPLKLYIVFLWLQKQVIGHWKFQVTWVTWLVRQWAVLLAGRAVTRVAEEELLQLCVRVTRLPSRCWLHGHPGLRNAGHAKIWFSRFWVWSLISGTYQWKWKQPATLMCIGADWCSLNLLSLGFVGFYRAASTLLEKYTSLCACYITLVSYNIEL